MTTRTTSKYRIRNYRAMTDSKLLRVKDELECGMMREAGEGGFYGSTEAYDRCLTRGSGLPDYDLEVCQDIIAERGL